MGGKFGDVSEAEMELLQLLWETGPGTVRELDTRLAPKKKQWAYTTIQTLLNRLETKGYVKSDKSGLAHVFRATVTRETFLSRRLLELADELCGGETTPLVMALTEKRKFSKKEIEAFRKLIDQFDQKGK